jgi:hypothetical protein
VANAVTVTDEILSNLMDRRGFDGVWDDLDDELRHEIRGEILEAVAKLVPGGPVVDDTTEDVP